MFARTGRIRSGEEGPYAPGGTFDRLARVGRDLAAPFLPRARGFSAEETDPPAEGVRLETSSSRPAMDAGITGGMSLLGGPAGFGRPKG
jgi:hypothetical protein